MVDVQHHRRQVGDLQAVVQAVGLFIVFKSDAVARHLRQARPHRARALHSQAPGDVHVALEVLELPAVAHHADHVGVVFELGQAVFHHARVFRAEHAILTRVEGQADIRRTCQLADGGKAVDQLAFDGGVFIHVSNFRVAVERQQITAQAQHAQGRRQFSNVGQQTQLCRQVMGDHFDQFVTGHLRRHAVHPAQGSGARVERAFDQLEGAGRQQPFGMFVLANKANARVSHVGARRKERSE